MGNKKLKDGIKRGNKEVSVDQLPYDIRVDLFESMIRELSKFGDKGMNINDLYKSVGSSMPVGTKSLGLCKFVSFVDSDSRKVWLTENGFSYTYADTDRKQEILSNSLPKPYVIMLKWLDSKESMSINEMKSSMIKLLQVKVSRRVLGGMVNSFGNVCQHAGLIEYTKGKSSRFQITSDGREFLSRPHVHNVVDNTQQKQFHEEVNSNDFHKDSSIIIITDFGKFITPMSSDDDWDVAEMRLKSWRKRWESCNKEDEENDKPS